MVANNIELLKMLNSSNSQLKNILYNQELPTNAPRVMYMTNKWGRPEEPETHIIFSHVACGVQNDDGSMSELSDFHINLCKQYGWGYFSTESPNQKTQLSRKKPQKQLNKNKNSNVGKRWKVGENEQLLKLYNEDKLDINEIAKLHLRNPRGIAARLVTLKVIDYLRDARGYELSDIDRELKNNSDCLVCDAHVSNIDYLTKRCTKAEEENFKLRKECEKLKSQFSSLLNANELEKIITNPPDEIISKYLKKFNKFSDENYYEQITFDDMKGAIITYFKSLYKDKPFHVDIQKVTESNWTNPLFISSDRRDKIINILQLSGKMLPIKADK